MCRLSHAQLSREKVAVTVQLAATVKKLKTACLFVSHTLGLLYFYMLKITNHAGSVQQ